ncbi:MAG: hypothetical protein LZF86_110491 [Nitrospira sp.]|nr:MAG: hypothetical protein LZF86_110491 [Nitrospira sp.]
MLAQVSHPTLFSSSHASLGVLTLAVLAVLSGCSSDDPAAPTAAPAALSLTATNTQIALSTDENDQLLGVVAHDTQYYATGFKTVNKDRHLVLARFDAAGTLDPTFGTNGVATINVAVAATPGQEATQEVARSVVVQSDGKIVIAATIEHDLAATGVAVNDTDIALVRFTATGQLDPTFGTAGISQLDLKPGVPNAAGTAMVGDTVYGLTLLSNDALLIVGAQPNGGVGRTDRDYAIVKFTQDGAKDTTFATDGVFAQDIGQGSDNPRNALVQPDGKIIASGYTGTGNVISTVLFRLSPTGQLDPTFGNAGIAQVPVLSAVTEAYDIAFQPNASGSDNIVMAGYGRDNSSSTVNIISARFLSNGFLDRSYGTNGIVSLDVSGLNLNDRSRNLEVLPSGHVLIVGQGFRAASEQDGVFALLTQNGQPETRLNGTGIAFAHFGGPSDALFGLALAPDKRSGLAVGFKGLNTSITTPAPPTPTNNDDAYVVRFTLPAL